MIFRGMIEGKEYFKYGGDTGDSGDIIIKNINNNVTDCDLISSLVSPLASPLDAIRGDGYIQLCKIWMRKELT